MRHKLLPAILLFAILSYSLIAPAAFGGLVVVRVLASYKASFDGYLVFPVNMNTLGCECDGKCVAVGVVRPDDIIINMTIDGRKVTLNYSLNITVYDISRGDSEEVCNATYDHSISGVLLDPLPLILAGKRITVIPWFYAAKVGDFRFSIFSVSEAISMPAYESPEDAVRFARTLNDTLRSANITVAKTVVYYDEMGQPHILILPINATELPNLTEITNKITVDNTSVIYYSGYFIVVGKPPGERYTVARSGLELDELDTGRIQGGVPGETLTMVGAHDGFRSILVFDGSHFLAALYNRSDMWKEVRVYVASPYPDYLVPEALYYWPAGVLLNLTLLVPPAAPFIVGLIMPPGEGSEKLLDYKYPLKINDMPPLLLVKAQSEAEAARILVPERLASQVGKLILASKDNLRRVNLHAVDFYAEKHVEATIESGTGLNPMLLVAAGSIILLVVIAAAYRSYRRRAFVMS